MGGAARSLTARGHDVRVLADGKADATDDTKAMGKVRYFSGWKRWRNLRKSQALQALLRSGPSQAVLADSWKSVETMQRSDCLDRIGRVVCFAHGNEFPEAPRAAKAERIRKALSAVHRVIAVSEFTAARVRSFAADIDIVVRAPAVEPVQAPSDEERLWASGLWGRGKPRILSLARLEPLKGVDHVLLAMRKLLPRYPDLHYIVAGGGSDLDRLKAITAENQLEARVSFVGPVTGARKSALYESADLFVMPTRPVGNRQEAFGMVYLEAAIHGLPVIGGLAGGAREAVRDGITGLLVDGHDVGSIAARLDELLSDRERRAAMGAAGRLFAEAFTWNNQIAALEVDLGLEAPQDI